MTAHKEPPRCPWVGIADPVYARYHDEEWGVPLIDDRTLFEKLVLESFQSGLSWLTILKKRDNFRQAFDDFDVRRIARYGDRDIARLMADAGIVRNRAKIEATIASAQACLRLTDRVSLYDFLWRLADAKPSPHRAVTMADVPAQSAQSTALAKALRAEGFRFLGPTTVYAFMQSAGMVNDHLADCHRDRACAKLQRAHLNSREQARR